MRPAGGSLMMASSPHAGDSGLLRGLMARAGHRTAASGHTTYPERSVVHVRVPVARPDGQVAERSALPAIHAADIIP